MQKLTEKLFFEWSLVAHNTSLNYWKFEDGTIKVREVPALITLQITEIAEAVEALRKEKVIFSETDIICLSNEHWQKIKDKFFPELAGFLLRCFDMLGGVLTEKTTYNMFNGFDFKNLILNEVKTCATIKMNTEKKMFVINPDYLADTESKKVFYINQNVLSYLQTNVIRLLEKANNDPIQFVRAIYEVWNFCLKNNCDINELMQFADRANKSRTPKNQ